LAAAALASAFLAAPPHGFAMSEEASEPLIARGLVVPLDQATISSRLEATIRSIGPENGAAFVAGETLVAFDCERFEAELLRAKVEAEAALDTASVKEELARAGSASKLQAILAAAEVKRADAAALVAEKQVKQCNIKAPYAGRVVNRLANAHETVRFGDPLIEIVGEGRLEIRIFVPSAWLRRLAVGRHFIFDVDETGERFDTEIIALGAAIDNVSQLVEVRAKLARGGVSLLAGMSGRVMLEAQP
jgi:RND family efflux transporter MFP subunit